MGRLESISSKKSLDWDAEEDGIEEMKWGANNDTRDSFDLLFTPEELRAMQASVPTIDDADKSLYEDSKNLEAVIREQIGESQIGFESRPLGQHTISSVGIDTIEEQNESEKREINLKELEEQFEISADEFAAIAKEGIGIKYEDKSSPEIDAIIDAMRDDW